TERGPLSLRRPKSSTGAKLLKTDLTIAAQESTYNVLQQLGEAVTIEAPPEGHDLYAAAELLAWRYRVELWTIYDQLQQCYSGGEVPSAHLDLLGRQIERWQGEYTVSEEKVDVALALVRPEGFQRATDASGA